MSDEKDKAIAMRDRLKEMAAEVMVGSPDMEDHVVACCLAVALEELENWIYDEKWTPSVRPYIDDRDFEIPFPTGAEEDPRQGGTPWNAKKVSMADRCPTVKKLKEQGRLEPKVADDDAKRLEWEPKDWPQEIMRHFREGDRPSFMRAFRIRGKIPMKKIVKYLGEMIARHPVLWGIDTKDGSVCPKCGLHDIEDRNALGVPVKMGDRSYFCRDCKTQWGYTW